MALHKSNWWINNPVVENNELLTSYLKQTQELFGDELYLNKTKNPVIDDLLKKEITTRLLEQIILHNSPLTSYLGK